MVRVDYFCLISLQNEEDSSFEEFVGASYALDFFSAVEYPSSKFWNRHGSTPARRAGAYLSTPKTKWPRLAAVVPHRGENRLLWLRTKARVGGGVTHGGNHNQWLLCTEASRASPCPSVHHPHQRCHPCRCSCKFLVLFPRMVKKR
jgi:hypothetical protein